MRRLLHIFTKKHTQLYLLGFIGFISFVIFNIYQFNKYSVLNSERITLVENNSSLSEQLASISAEITSLQSIDQNVRNNELEKKINNIEQTFNKTVSIYEDIIVLKEKNVKLEKIDESFAKILTLLSKQNYASASSELSVLTKLIQTEQDKLTLSATPTIPGNVPQNNTPPGTGYSRQQVSTEIGNFIVSIVAADLSSTRVLVDTAADNTCSNDCPVLPLSDYVARNGAYAGINGSYFCPASYPSCSGKTNSFDTLLMNKNKVYFNSDNNVYSTVPAVIFGNGWIRFVGQSLEWGRDTSIDSMIANQPLLVSGGNVVFNGDGDPKKGNKGGRSFIANRGNSVYIGIVHSATVAESARVLKTLGMENALNLDDGGSTALWHQGYKSGPGRNIPNAILFVGK